MSTLLLFYLFLSFVIISHSQSISTIWDPIKTFEFISNSNGNDYNYFVADPNSYLEKDERKTLIKHLEILQQKNIQVFFIIICKVDVVYAYNRSGIELFVYELSYYMKKNNAKIQKDNSLYIIYSIDDERSIMKPGEIVSEKLPENECNKIQTRRLSQVRDGEYFEAFDNLLKDTIHFEDVCDDCVTFWVGIAVLGFTALVAVIAISIKLFLCIRGRTINKDEEIQFNKISQVFSQYETNKAIIDDLCFICLSKVELNEESTQIKVMNCKHKMHLNCFALMVEKEDDETCIVCIEKIDKEDDKEKMFRKIINIQSKFYPVFKEMLFYISDNNLKWKFSNKFQTTHELLDSEE